MEGAGLKLTVMMNALFYIKTAQMELLYYESLLNHWHSTLCLIHIQWVCKFKSEFLN